jgi:serine/threonine protein kinase
MGEVYRADDLKLKQPVALKFLPEALSADGAALARFHQEVSVARQISHRHVCRVYDVAEADGFHFISMEYVRGEELSSLLKRIGRLPEDKAVETARQLCAGLAAVHDAGVLHRDLKPANVMLDERGDVRITAQRPLLARPRPLRNLHRQARLRGRVARRADTAQAERHAAHLAFEPRQRPRPARRARHLPLP